MTDWLIPALALLSAAEEIELARAVEAGALAHEILDGRWAYAAATPAELVQLRAEGLQARERFVLANLRLVTLVVRPAPRQSRLSFRELFSEAVPGLITAVDRFDHRVGVRFATYALPWIRACVARALATRCGALPVSDAHAEKRRKVRTAWFRLSEDLGRDASATEVGAAIGYAPDTVRELLALQPPCSLVDGAGMVVDPPDPRAQTALDAVVRGRSDVAAWLRRLTALEQRVVRLRFGFDGDPSSYAVIAATLGLSKSSVRRVEARALDRLREWCPSETRAMTG